MRGIRRDESGQGGLMLMPILALLMGALLAWATGFSIDTWSWILIAVVLAFVTFFAWVMAQITVLGWLGMFLLFLVLGAAIATVLFGG